MKAKNESKGRRRGHQGGRGSRGRFSVSKPMIVNLEPIAGPSSRSYEEEHTLFGKQTKMTKRRVANLPFSLEHFLLSDAPPRNKRSRQQETDKKDCKQETPLATPPPAMDVNSTQEVVLPVRERTDSVSSSVSYDSVVEVLGLSPLRVDWTTGTLKLKTTHHKNLAPTTTSKPQVIRGSGKVGETFKHMCLPYMFENCVESDDDVDVDVVTLGTVAEGVHVDAAFDLTTVQPALPDLDTEQNKTLADQMNEKCQPPMEFRKKSQFFRNENVVPEPATTACLHMNNQPFSPKQVTSPMTQLYNEVIAERNLRNKIFAELTDCGQSDLNFDQNFESVPDETMIVENIGVKVGKRTPGSQEGCNRKHRSCDNDEDETMENEETVLMKSNISTSDLRTRKRKSRLERYCSKVLRNTGKSYVSAKGKVVPARKRKELSSCRLECAKRFTMEEQMHCFESYWKLGDREKRAAFVSNSMKILPKKSQITSSRVVNREFYCKYMLEIFKVVKPICKECFCRILGETKGFVNVIMAKKKESPNGIIKEDKKGQKPPTNSRTDEKIESVKNHILSFPSYESHYCGKSTGNKYLAADLSVAKMYREYKKNNSKPVSLKVYNNCFYDLNLSFKIPSKDECNTCDYRNTKNQNPTDCRFALLDNVLEHHDEIEEAIAEKRVDKERARADTSVRAYEFDLQQCLPTPYLKTSVSFYKRQLWSFNLTIHDLATNETTCYMWDETIGARGANEIASCLWHFCNTLPSEVKELIFYSDICGGQTKNNIVAMMFMFLLNNHATLQVIHHKFIVSGHTHMECESDHTIIEKTKKKTQMKINHLNDWVQLVRSCKAKKPFKVVVMTLNNFLDFSELKSKNGPFAIKKTDDEGNPFLWKPIKWLNFNKNNIGNINFKKSLERETPFQSINFKKKGKFIVFFTLRQISKEPLPISSEKKKDLIDVLEYIDDAFKNFYLQIKTVNDASSSNDPDLDEDDPDKEDSEE